MSASVDAHDREEEEWKQEVSVAAAVAARPVA
jgi:hypothetical protein